MGNWWLDEEPYPGPESDSDFDPLSVLPKPGEIYYQDGIPVGIVTRCWLTADGTPMVDFITDDKFSYRWTAALSKE